MTVRINKQKINLREKLAGVEDKVNFDEVVRGLGEYGGNVGIGATSPDARFTAKSIINTPFSNISPSVSDCLISIANNPASEAANNHASLQFNLNAGIHNHVASISLISESSTLRRGALAFCTDDGINRPEAMRIDSAGNVGIGTTNPDNRLHIEGSDFTSSSLKLYRKTVGQNNDPGIIFQADAGENNNYALGAIYFKTSVDDNTYAKIRAKTDDDTGTSGRLEFTASAGAITNSTSPSMIIDSAGNVGIGTTDPGAMLEIFDSIKPVIKLNGTGNNALNTNFGEIQFYNRDGSGDGPNVAASIHAQSHSSTGSGGSLVFSTEDAAAGVEGQSAEPRMTILSNGNVGIGTTDPDALLDVEGSLDQLNSASIINNSSTGYGFLTKGGGNGTARYIADFRNKDDLSCLKIDGAGDVGIGTTNPAQKLDVHGNIAVSGVTVHSSDDRVKHNEQPIVGALETLSKIIPKKYIKTIQMYDADHDFELDADGNPVDSNGELVEHRIEAGVIAQQVLTVDELAFAVSPEGVDEDGTVTSPHGLDYNSLFTYAIAAIQEQQQLIEDLKSRIETLEQQ